MADDQQADQGFSKLKPEPGSEIPTEFANVKSRISWTPERQQLLREMWERGDKAADIAKALGIKPGTVSVARARFKLTPRRDVPGRPKEPDEPAHRIERVAFTTSRLMEFCTEKELVAQTGHQSYEWPRVITKELVDNGIDACEEAEVAPSIKVTITTGHAKSRRRAAKPTRIVFEDNGPGIPPETIGGIIDYNVRVSSREAYISPTRGRQGNALKSILPMAYVLGGEGHGETWIEAREIKHRILFSVNQIRQEPIVDHTMTSSRVTTGTRVTVFWPAEATVEYQNEYDRTREADATFQTDAVKDLLSAFIWVNPHLTLLFRADGKTVLDHTATSPKWSKYRACDATSAQWYTLDQIERYAGALIARDEDHQARHPRASREKTTVRDFIAQFRGMKPTDKQKQVLRELGAAHMSLRRFFGSEKKANHQRMEKLLGLLQQHTRPVRPELLGVIGEEHLRQMLVNAGGEPQSVKYVVVPDVKNGAPRMLEIATCPFKEWVDGEKERARRRMLITAINFSATLKNPFEELRGFAGLSDLLATLHAGEYAPVIVAVHYACPHIEYLDRGKSRIGLE